VKKVRVNERHDIMLGRDKVSGSAYKLTRLRSLHHGTCLLESPNLREIGKFLRSHAKGFIKARGVESVRSPIINVHLHNEEFESAVVSEFFELYRPCPSTAPVFLTDSAQDIPDIGKGFEELKSLDWIYCQTPQFTFSTHDSGQGGELPEWWQDNGPGLRLTFTARHGVFTAVDGDVDQSTGSLVGDDGVKLHEVRDWGEWLDPMCHRSHVRWINSLFGLQPTSSKDRNKP